MIESNQAQASSDQTRETGNALHYRTEGTQLSSEKASYMHTLVA